LIVPANLAREDARRLPKLRRDLGAPIDPAADGDVAGGVGAREERQVSSRPISRECIVIDEGDELANFDVERRAAGSTATSWRARVQRVRRVRA
jgi:hypothetical protein